jgi:hypothetical protein
MGRSIFFFIWVVRSSDHASTVYRDQRICADRVSSSAVQNPSHLDAPNPQQVRQPLSAVNGTAFKTDLMLDLVSPPHLSYV